VSGAVLSLAGAGAAGGGSGTAGAISWTNIYSQSGGATNEQTLSGITGSLTITATNSGDDSTLYYTLNGVSSLYTGAFQWPNGQALSWYLIAPGVGTVTVSGPSGVLDSFSYSITNPRNGEFS
jgi:hypothetical protein